MSVLWSGGESPSSRWIVLARPGVCRVLPATATKSEAESFLRDVGFDRAIRQHASNADKGTPPFRGGWIGWLSYELGGVLEPRARVEHAPRRLAGAVGKPPPSDWPLTVFQRCDDALIFDRSRGRWWSIGTPPALLASAERTRPADAVVEPGAGARDRYARAVRVAREYIHAGDAYQVNLSHALRGGTAIPPREFAALLFESSGPWFGGFIEHTQGGRAFAVASASPELFLSFDPIDGLLRSRPMKGTRPAGNEAAHDLRRSEKDTAELAMIVDLVRNDLGRVCDLGSVRVEAFRVMERHGGGRGLLQTTATVAGRPRDDATWLDAIHACFPGGSVTGAPKIRAMQIIDELEGEPRGPYCGSMGYIGDSGHAAFNILIRTAAIRSAEDGWDLTWRVGAGIVAESDPEREWQETLDKARSLRAALAGRANTPR